MVETAPPAPKGTLPIARVRATIRRFAEAGVERLMLQDLLPWDLEMIRDMGRGLVGRV